MEVISYIQTYLRSSLWRSLSSFGVPFLLCFQVWDISTLTFFPLRSIRPNVEWLNGMKTDGSFGHFKSEFVTEILNPVDDIRAKLASGQTSVSDIVIGSPTHVDHMTHYNKDGSKWVSESADEL